MQGWIDTIYMNADGTFRLARGNKGTLFVREYTGQPAQEFTVWYIAATPV